jgi:hypothetical protein
MIQFAQCLWLLSLALFFVAKPTTTFGEELQLPPVADKVVDYEKEIEPLLAKNCLKCHGSESQESNFRVDVRSSLLKGGDFGEPAVVPGKSATSHLVHLVSGADDFLFMPPEDAGKPLSADEIGLLRAWIDQGMKMPDGEDAVEQLSTEHWSFQAISRPEVPKNDDPWASHPIDAFILQRLQEAGLTPSPKAEKRVLIRRVYLDMLGLQPTPKEMQAFVSDDSPDAYEKLIDHVLASPHYGERWARHWLDVVRFAESDGYETNHERPNAFHYRDWVIRALNEDMPYDKFLTAQLAGDQMSEDPATGFLVGGAYDRVKSPDPTLTLMQRQDELADMVNTTSTAFLGLTVGCARCHKHKFDPILQKDYYSLLAVFSGVTHGEREFGTTTEDKNREAVAEIDVRIAHLAAQAAELKLLPPINSKINEERFQPILAKRVRFTIEGTNASEPCIDELEIWTATEPPTNLALASSGSKTSSSGNYAGNAKHQLAHVNDGIYGNDKSWISNENGKGWVEIEFPQTAEVDRVVWGRDRTGQYTDRTAIQYRIEVSQEDNPKAEGWQQVSGHGWHLPQNLDTIQTSDTNSEGPTETDVREAVKIAKEIQSLQTRRDTLTQKQKVYAGVFRQPAATHRLYRGDPMAPREQVAPETLTVLHAPVGSLNLEFTANESTRRAKLAEWMVNKENPLTSRVIVNRLWQYHFGRGIVATPSDFGGMGFKPTHPELLDWLASELVDPSDESAPWSLKHIHRLILNSNTYQQASTPRHEAIQKDRGATLLWRYPPRRMEAEAIRDNILLVSGALNKEMYGPGFMMFQPNSNYSRNWIAKDEFGPAEFRRMIYALDLRMEHDAVFGAFDCPDGGQVMPKRGRSTTPIQALNLFNSKFIAQQSELLASRVTAEVGGEPNRQVERSFELTVLREPSSEETVDAVALVKEHGLPALCRAMLNTSEFLFIP